MQQLTLGRVPTPLLCRLPTQPWHILGGEHTGDRPAQVVEISEPKYDEQTAQLTTGQSVEGPVGWSGMLGLGRPESKVASQHARAGGGLMVLMTKWGNSRTRVLAVVAI